MFKLILSFFLFISSVFAAELNSEELSLNTNVTALNLHKNTLFIGGDDGVILTYDLENKILNELISLPKVQNYYEKSGARIYSLDVLNDDFIGILGEGDYGAKDLHIIKNKEHKIIKQNDSGAKKIFLLDENTLLVALLGSEIKLYELENFKLIKSFKFSHSSLNDIVLNEDKSLAIAGFESGEVELFDIKKWALIANFKDMHKDNVYQVDFKANTAISCATDRRVGLVENIDENSVKKGSQSFLQKDFLIYACSLSPKANFGAYADNSQNEISIFNTQTHENLAKLNTNDLVNEFIIFISESEFLVSGFGNKILFAKFKD